MDFNRRCTIIGLAALGGVKGSVVLARSPAGPPVARDLLMPDIGPRERRLLDLDWRFQLGDANDVNRDFQFGANQRAYAKQGVGVSPAASADFSDIAWGQSNFDDSAWQPVDLPHDWAVSLPFVPNAAFKATGPTSEDPRHGHGYKPLGREYPATSIGWYRKRFTLAASDEGRRLSLEFDGVFRDCVVMFNGYILARNESGYAPFRVDITDFANLGGPNLLTVRVDATQGEGWFYEGAGLYRHVWLIKTDPVHVPQWGVVVRGELDGAVAFACEIKNESDVAREVRVRSTIQDAAGVEVARSTSSVAQLEPWSTVTVDQTAQIAAPIAWTPGAPHLYRLLTQVEANGVVDRVVTRFGLRSIRFDPDEGFFLNGQSLKLRGANIHQDHAGVGVAVPDGLHRFRVQRLKDMGVNAIRMSHNPCAPELLDVCDEMGVLVIAENRMMSSSLEGQGQLEKLVKRDRNHPCVIAWSIGNEEPQQSSVRGQRIARSLMRTVRRLDPTRIAGAAMDNSYVKPEGISPVIDFIGVNYNGGLYAEIHKAFPGKVIIGTETGSSLATRGVYVRNDQKRHLDAYDSNKPRWGSLASEWLPQVETTPYVAGGFVWTGFDYRGEQTPYYTWPSIGSQFGIMDSCGFAKDTFFYLRSWWRPEPALHLFPHWNWEGREGQEIEVWCHTNLDRVELLLNGVRLGAQTVERFGQAKWKVPFQAGTLMARGYRDGQLVMTDVRATTGPAAGVRLTPDRAAIAADGEDVSVVTVSIVDRSGRLVPTADPLVTFSIEGPGRIIGVGNGDPASHEPDQAPRRSAFNGLCQLIIRSERAKPGQIALRASAEGLTSATFQITARPGALRPVA